MKRICLGYLLVGVMGFALIGCGDDDDRSLDAGPPLVDQCTNASDLAIAEVILTAQMDAGVGDAGSVDAGSVDAGPYDGYLTAITTNLQACASGPCLNAVFAQSGVPECMSDCLAGNPEENLSDGCFECFSEVVRCASEFCLNECLGTSQALCDACSETYCTPRLVACTGLPSTGN